MTASGDIQLVIPMAGLGSRFAERGYAIPKPLLTIHGLNMYRLVLSNLLTEEVGRVAIVAQEAWQLKESIAHLSDAINLEVALIEINYVTGGPADTVQLAESWLDLDRPVVTANSDQYVHADVRSFYETLGSGTVSGALLLMEDEDPKWSYARLNDWGEVIEIREKAVISPFATVGVYGFSSAGLMLDAFATMRRCDDRVNGEFYVGPAYNYLPSGALPIASINLGPVSTVMFGLGTPEDYELFISTEVSVEAVNKATGIGIPL